MERSLDPTADLIARHGMYVRRLARALTRDEHAAHDVEQEVWRAALEQSPRDVERPRSWIATLARRTAWRRARSEARRYAREAEVATPERVDGPDERALDVIDAVQAALRRLPEPLRDVVVERYLRGHAPRVIAERTGVPLGTVKSRLKRALAALRADLDRTQEGGRDGWVLAFAPLAVPAGGVPLSSPSDMQTGDVLTGSSRTWNWMWTAAVAAMNVKILLPVVAAAVIAVAVWTSNTGAPVPRTAPVAPADDARDVALAPVAVVDSPMARAPVTGEVAEPETPAAAMHTFEMTFSIVDGDGMPFSGVDVQLAPEDHAFVRVGTTDAAGELSVTWEAAVPAMLVDMVFVHRSEDLSSVHRLEVTAGRVRNVRARLERDDAPVTLADLRSKLDDMRSMVDMPASSRRWPLRPPGVVEGEPQISFAMVGAPAAARTFRELGYVSAIEYGTVQLGETPPNEARVEGVVTDEYGRVAARYPVRCGPDDGNTRCVHTDANGQFRLVLPPGRVTLSIGEGDVRVEQALELEPAGRVTWNPRVTRARDLMLDVSVEDPSTVGARVVLDDGTSLWIARATADDRGRIWIPNCPTSTVDVDLFALETWRHLPVERVEAVATGERVSYALSTPALEGASLNLGVDDRDRPEHCATELIALDAEGLCGTRLRVGGETGSTIALSLPRGVYRLELASRQSGRTDLGSVIVDGETPVDLGAVPLEPLGRLVVEEARREGAVYVATRLREDVETRAAVVTSGGAEAPAPLALRPGRYRVECWRGETVEEAWDVELGPGETVRLGR